MASYKKLWLILATVCAVTLGILGYYGTEVYRQAPPIPDKVLSTSGEVLMTEETILNGQTAWQSIGGMQVGSIWGHGAYQAPDWTADWLHRELIHWLDITAQDKFGKTFADLEGAQQRHLKYLLAEEYRNNRYNAESGTLVVSDTRLEAMELTKDYYMRLFGDDPDYATTRANFSMKNDTLPDESRRAEMTEFFFWTATAAATNRPDKEVTYTNN